MNVLLVKPFNRSDHIQPSLGLGYLATALRKRHEVRILDCIKEGMTIERFRAFLDGGVPDVVGIQCYTFDLPFVREALAAVKERRRDAVTVIGGPHPSALPAETMALFGDRLDFLFVGEAEEGFAALVERSAGQVAIALDEIPGLVWRAKDGSVRVNARRVTDELDRLGLPAWDLIKPQTYPESQHGAFFQQFPIAPIMVTRGCPFPCTFCAGGVVSGRKVRRRGIDAVLGELTLLRNDFGIREFHIIDDNFTMDTVYAKEFLRRLKKLDLGMSWAVPNGVRMDTLDTELLGLMRDTGLYLVSLGIESGSDDVLKRMKKGITTAVIREKVRMIHDFGIDIAGFFILGFPGETVGTVRQTIRFAVELPLARANFFTYLPFPGSESYADLVKSGELDGVDWDRFYFTTAAYAPQGMSRETLKALHRQAFAAFYLRPRIVLYHIRSIKSLRHFCFLAKRFINWIVL